MLRRHAPDLPLGLESQKEPPIRVDIVVLQIQAREPWIIPSNPLLLHKSFQQPELGDPIEAPDKLSSIAGEYPQRGSPFAQDPIGFRISTGQMLFGREVVLFLNVE